MLSCFLHKARIAQERIWNGSKREWLFLKENIAAFHITEIIAKSGYV